MVMDQGFINEIKDWDLLDEVVDLVEFPKTIRCQFLQIYWSYRLDSC